MHFELLTCPRAKTYTIYTLNERYINVFTGFPQLLSIVFPEILRKLRGKSKKINILIDLSFFIFYLSGFRNSAGKRHADRLREQISPRGRGRGFGDNVRGVDGGATRLRPKLVGFVVHVRPEQRATADRLRLPAAPPPRPANGRSDRAGRTAARVRNIGGGRRSSSVPGRGRRRRR